MNLSKLGVRFRGISFDEVAPESSLDATLARLEEEYRARDTNAKLVQSVQSILQPSSSNPWPSAAWWPDIFTPRTPAEFIFAALNVAGVPGKVTINEGKWTPDRVAVIYELTLDVKCSVCGKTDTLRTDWDVRKIPAVEGTIIELTDIFPASELAGWRRLKNVSPKQYADPLPFSSGDVVTCSIECLHTMFNVIRDDTYPQEGGSS